MNKYRIKLEGGRVVGPVEKEEILELVKAGLVKGTEECQLFPVGDWGPLSQYKELKVGLAEVIVEKKEDLDKTEVRKSIPVTEEVEKTQLNPDYQKYLRVEKLKKEKLEEERRQKDKSKAEENEVEIVVDYENEATQMLNLNELDKQLKTAMKVEEFEEKVIARKSKEKKKLEDLKEKKPTEKATEKKSKKASTLAVILFLICIAVILDMDTEETTISLKPIVVIEPDIIFPSRLDTEDQSLATANYSKGLELLSTYEYSKINKAAKFFQASVLNKFDKNNALAKLIFSYSLMLNESKTFNEDASKIFKLIQYVFSKSILEADYTAAITTFYIAIERYEAAALYTEKYLTIRGRKITPHLYVNYLTSLLRTGSLEKIQSSKVLETLEKIQDKDLYTTTMLYRYYKSVDEQGGKRKKLLNYVTNKYPNSVYFLLENAFSLIEQSKFKEVVDIIFKINKLQAEGASSYYSEYLILQGFLYSAKKDIDKAAQYFEKSLKTHESKNLIDKLSNLDYTDNTLINSLISTSKLKKEINLARAFEKKKDYKNALNVALRAREIDKNSIELRILLSELSLKRGYVNDATGKLKKLFKEYPNSRDVLVSLIDATIEAYDFRETANLLNIAKNFEGMRELDFFKLRGKLAKFRKRYAAQSTWLQKAYAIDPLSDEVILELANLYIKAYQYPKAKRMLNKGIELDPSNLDFRLGFARVLYEEETSNAAVGYLYDVLKDFPDNPQVLSEIGINYYKSGLIKKYKNIKDELLAIPEKSESLFIFLIESARLDDDIEKITEHSEELLYINPGNLKIRLQLAESYINLEKYKNAKLHLDKLSERHIAYPKLQFLYAKLYYMIKNNAKAKELVLKEIEFNPGVVDGYILYAKILLDENKLEDAKRSYLKAVQVNDKSIEAILGIAQIEVQRNKFEIALDQYQKAMEIQPSNAKIYRLMAETYKKLGQSQFAIKNYKQFLELSPNSSYKSSIESYIRTME